MMALTYVPLNVPMDVIAPVLLIAATIVQFWAGGPIYQAAWAAARMILFRFSKETLSRSSTAWG